VNNNVDRHTMSDADKLKSPHAAPPSDSPVPIGLLREPQQLDSMPYEMQIIKTLAFRFFAPPVINRGEPHASYFPHCCIYQVSSPLVTQYVHYYEKDRLQVKYRMGLTETWPCLGFVDYCGAHETWMF